MNAKDRKRVAELKSQLEDLETNLTSIGNALRDLADAEQEKFDNLSDGIAQSERGEAIEMAVEMLDTAAGACEDGMVTDAIAALAELE